MHILRAEHVYKSFPYQDTTLSVLKDLTITFNQGTSYAITGVSGIGKSTLMYILAGLDTPTAGSMYFDDYKLRHFSDSHYTQFLTCSVGLLFQNAYLIRELSVEENVMLPGMVTSLPSKECKKRAHELLAQVGIVEKHAEAVGALSGGQQQRVALARALFHKPHFLLADEPTGNLDEKTGFAIIELLLTCQKEWGMGIIVSTHDQYVAQAMNIRYQLRDGTLHQL